ncbi:hypothetical protein NE237_006142 [Protea cynaroides]|uniref:Cytochrome c assembly protein domain-containing protein n=1 Tax=Protea cynaroides TaxID=273540 RepID=A0A9Q0KLS5_9MAGN|nr:hypothetical protein NE237_006142 [Protea cynaroides]
MIKKLHIRIALRATRCHCHSFFDNAIIRSYMQILIGSQLFLTVMAIHLSLQVAPQDLQQGGNSHIPYVHVPAFMFPLTKHPLFLRLFGTGTQMSIFSMLYTLVIGGFWGRPMWGTFWVWDARLTSVFILFLIYLGAFHLKKLPVEPAPIFIRVGPIDIRIIKSLVNCTSIHVPMLIPIFSYFANSPFSTHILFILETCLPIPSFPESPLMDEIEARKGGLLASSLVEIDSSCRKGTKLD